MEKKRSGAWTVARITVGIQVDSEEIAALEEPWQSAARAVAEANGGGRINALRAFCDGMDAAGEELFKAVLAEDAHKAPQRRQVRFGVPPLPRTARLEPAADEPPTSSGWLAMYTDYAKSVSPRTPESFHEANGLWLVSLAIARRMVLGMSHKDVYPNIAVLQVAPTTLYAKSTGLGVPRHVARLVMQHLLLPGEMTPESMIDELAGKQPAILEGLDLGEWQRGQDYAAQRGIVLDEASSLFSGMTRDYNVGMGETLLRLLDCDPHVSRQTRGGGRSTVRNSYFTFLGATTPYHLKRADVDSLWHTGLWPRFLLLTPDAAPEWHGLALDRPPMPAGLRERLARLCIEQLPESTLREPATPISVGLGDGVFAAYCAYLKATMHDLLVPPTSVDRRLWGVYGRLAEQALKISMLLAGLDWTGSGAPVISLRHWTWAQRFVERCRESAHRLPAMLAQSSQDEDEARVLMWLDGSGDEWNTARDVYRATNMKSSQVKTILLDLQEADLVEAKQQGRAWYYRVKRDEGEI